MHMIKPAMLALFLSPSCGPVVDVNVGSGGGTGDTGDSATETDADSASESGVADTTGSSDSGSSSAASSSTGSESSSGSDESTSSGGGACILPQDGSWCTAQLEVAQEIDCLTSADPDTCYAVVGAMYKVGDGGRAVEAADCVPAGPGDACELAIEECEGASGPSTCMLFESDLNSCQVLPQMQGIGFKFSEPFCVAILDVYGD